MKVSPKRKGNSEPPLRYLFSVKCLNESPSQKEGKSLTLMVMRFERVGLNESPSQKEGKFSSGVSAGTPGFKWSPQ